MPAAFIFCSVRLPQEFTCVRRRFFKNTSVIVIKFVFREVDSSFSFGKMSACVNERVFVDSPLKSKVALFNNFADKHVQGQAINPFSNGQVGGLPKPTITKEEYGKPPKGSLSELRAFKATIHVSREMLELCQVIDQCGERLFTEQEKPDDPRKVISFGELFTIYTAISDKVVGILLRARKYNFVDFEGECLFQRRDDHVPIILLKPIKDIRKILEQRIEEATKALRASGEI